MSEEEDKYSSDEILFGIKNHDRAILQYVYDTYFDKVRIYVDKRKGSENDAWDIFQDAMGVFYDYSQKQDFVLKVSFQAFFFTIIRFVWYDHAKNRRSAQSVVQFDMDTLPLEDDEMLREMLRNQIISKLARKHLAKLKKSCVLLIKYSSMGIATDLIAKKLNYHSTQAVYNQKRKCLRKLIKEIMDDPAYKNLSDYERP
ncbi:MAG: hypothetical protein KJ578_01465 [Bacteroidetes bacterium]|nr:hypothetical protein [Bacteroidota bacterium]MBU1578953.1 hypothetical protein [Bacteroidota bacterium]MBU2556430.1 hypothetical protein [Bacteroidota bacterium]